MTLDELVNETGDPIIDHSPLDESLSIPQRISITLKSVDTLALPFLPFSYRALTTLLSAAHSPEDLFNVHEQHYSGASRFSYLIRPKRRHYLPLVKKALAESSTLNQKPSLYDQLEWTERIAVTYSSTPLPCWPALFFYGERVFNTCLKQSTRLKELDYEMAQHKNESRFKAIALPKLRCVHDYIASKSWYRSS